MIEDKYFNKKLTKNKYLEGQVNFYNLLNNISLGFSIDIRRKCDHAGISFSFAVPGIACYIEVYDIRHWDDETNTWEVYNS